LYFANFNLNRTFSLKCICTCYCRYLFIEWIVRAGSDGRRAGSTMHSTDRTDYSTLARSLTSGISLRYDRLTDVLVQQSTQQIALITVH